MIGRLRGILLDKQPDQLLLEVGGVGYLAYTSLQSFQVLPQKGQEVILYTHLHVREDALTLYGFVSQEETDVFERLIAVSGIGPRLALTLLSGFDIPQLVDVLQRGDLGQLSKLPGIGKKTAERLVLELRDKLGPRRLGQLQAVPMVGGLKGMVGDVAAALCQLGYRLPDAEKAAQFAIKEQPDGRIEQLLRAALQWLQRA